MSRTSYCLVCKRETPWGGKTQLKVTRNNRKMMCGKCGDCGRRKCSFIRGSSTSRSSKVNKTAITRSKSTSFKQRGGAGPLAVDPNKTLAAVKLLGEKGVWSRPSKKRRESMVAQLKSDKEKWKRERANGSDRSWSEYLQKKRGWKKVGSCSVM